MSLRLQVRRYPLELNDSQDSPVIMEERKLRKVHKRACEKLRVLSWKSARLVTVKGEEITEEEFSLFADGDTVYVREKYAESRSKKQLKPPPDTKKKEKRLQRKHDMKLKDDEPEWLRLHDELHKDMKFAVYDYMDEHPEAEPHREPKHQPSDFRGSDMSTETKEGAEEGNSTLRKQGKPPALPVEASDMSTAQQEMLQFRQRLPAFSFAQEIVKAVLGNQAVVISGETGCGKTTQVPQFLLDDCIRRGITDVNMICTQPRRISAIGVAERVAAERGESIGASVGYQIRLERRASATTRLLFCTTGILLRRLINDPQLTGVSHIIVDEIHERSLDSDFLLIILRDLLPKRPDLKVILMSATLNADQFSSYFNSAPVVHIPGFTFPVAKYFLEDALLATGFHSSAEDLIMDDSRASWKSAKFRANKKRLKQARSLQHRVDRALEDVAEEQRVEARRKKALRLREATEAIDKETEFKDYEGYLNSDSSDSGSGSDFGEDESNEDREYAEESRRDWEASAKEYGGKGNIAEASTEDEIVEEIEDLARRKCPRKVINTVTNVLADGKVPLELIVAIIRFVVSKSGPFPLLKRVSSLEDDRDLGDASNGPSAEEAILVFLPGWDDISKLYDLLRNDEAFGRKDKFMILPLHGSMPTVNQKAIFDRPPKGIRKIVLATNIAETSITIDDVGFVIDCGKHKEKTYQTEKKVQCLLPTWVSKASATQRRGRAGRVRPGVCFHLFTQHRERLFVEYQVPEMHRVPLDQLCLQVKVLGLANNCSIAAFLSKALEPPAPLAVENALELLEELDALKLESSGDGGSDEEAAFIAAANSGRTLHERETLTPLGERLAFLPVTPQIGKSLIYGCLFGCVDPILTICACLSFKSPFVMPIDKKELVDKKKRQLSNYTQSDHFAVKQAFDGWASRPHKERGAYCHHNFLSSQTLKMIRDMREQFREILEDLDLLQQRVAKSGAVRVVTASGLGPNDNSDKWNVVKGALYAGLHPNLIRVDYGKRRPHLLSKLDRKLQCHPSSVNARESKFEHRWLMYHEKVLGVGGIQVFDTSPIGPLPILLFGTSGPTSSLHVSSAKYRRKVHVGVSDWVYFQAEEAQVPVLQDFRGILRQALFHTIARPTAAADRTTKKVFRVAARAMAQEPLIPMEFRVPGPKKGKKGGGGGPPQWVYDKFIKGKRGRGRGRGGGGGGRGRGKGRGGGGGGW